MLYQLKMGKAERGIIRECRRTGRPLPPKIMGAPELFFGLELYFNAFMELNSCRAVGFGCGPIPWTAIADYGKAHEFDDDQMDDLFFHVRAMDSAYLEYVNSKKD